MAIILPRTARWLLFSIAQLLHPLRRQLWNVNIYAQGKVGRSLISSFKHALFTRGPSKQAERGKGRCADMPRSLKEGPWLGMHVNISANPAWRTLSKNHQHVSTQSSEGLR